MEWDLPAKSSRPCAKRPGCNKPPHTNTALDVYQVIRNRLAWDRARADGYTGDKPPTWGVSFDQPLQTSPEPLPQMTASEPDQTPSKTGTKDKK